MPKVITPHGLSRNRNEGNNVVGDSSTISDEVSTGSYEEFDQVNPNLDERDSGSTFSSDQREPRGRLLEQQSHSRLSSSVPGQKRTRSTLSTSSDDTKQDFKPPLATFSPDPQQRRGSSQLNARPSTGIPMSRQSRVRNESPASQIDTTTPTPYPAEGLINSILQSSSQLPEAIMQMVNQFQFRVDQSTSSKDQMMAKMEKLRKELDSKKLEVIQVNNHLQAHKKINEIYQIE